MLFHALTIEREGRFDTVKEFSGQLMPYLGDVRRGKRELARIVGDATDDAADMPDEASEDDGLDMTDLDGLGGRAAQVAPRLFSLAACLFLVVVSLGNMPRIAGGTGSAALAYWAVVGVAAAAALLLIFPKTDEGASFIDGWSWLLFGICFAGSVRKLNPILLILFSAVAGIAIYYVPTVV